MTDEGNPKRPHPDVLAPGETAPPPKFNSPPLGTSATPEKGTISPETAAMMAGMTREERDDYFRSLLKTTEPADLIRIYGVSESYLAVIAEDEE